MVRLGGGKGKLSEKTLGSNTLWKAKKRPFQRDWGGIHPLLLPPFYAPACSLFLREGDKNFQMVVIPVYSRLIVVSLKLFHDNCLIWLFEDLDSLNFGLNIIQPSGPGGHCSSPHPKLEHQVHMTSYKSKIITLSIFT